jgi:hypothetical protein
LLPIATTMHLPFVDKLAEPAIGKVLLMSAWFLLSVIR